MLHNTLRNSARTKYYSPKVTQCSRIGLRSGPGLRQQSVALKELLAATDGIDDEPGFAVHSGYIGVMGTDPSLGE